jgi:hypothetical protein
MAYEDAQLAAVLNDAKSIAIVLSGYLHQTNPAETGEGQYP